MKILLEDKKLYRAVNSALKQVDLFSNDASILVACSGGPDSMVLLEVLCYLKKHRKANWTIGVATMDHQIRPEGIEELRFVEAYCKTRSLPFWGISCNIPALSKERKSSLETVGRDERYRWLSEVAQKEQFDYIAVAHHLDDQSETIMAHIIRGSGLKGLQGMRILNETSNVPIVRPLLNITKADILRFANHQNIPYCTDQTNDDITYNRNRIRHCVMPELVKINPQVVNALSQLGHIASEDDDYMTGESKRYYATLVKPVDGGHTISRRSLRALHIALQRRIWDLLIPQLSLSFAHQKQLAAIVQSGEPKTLIIGSITIEAQCDTIKVYCQD